MPEPPAGAPGLDAKLQFLRALAAQAGTEPPLETHMSWVFFVGEQVLKLKKPVRHPFLDFSTLAAREFFCREELRLNRRLAPGVYLGLLALRWRDGAFSLGPEAEPAAPGRVVDWLVRMRRLPAKQMLDRRIARGDLVPRDIEALGAVLAAFYRGQPPLRLPAEAYLQRFHREQAANREVLLRPQFDLPGTAAALDRFDAALVQGAQWLRQRAQQGRLVEGHGDLRPEHVCLLRPPVVIDALEFNRRLREVDPFDELSFLGGECAAAGAPWIGPQLIGLCATALGDSPPAALLALYAAHRALLRARLAMAHLLDPQPRTPEKWAPQAQRHLAQALAALDRLQDAFSAAPPGRTP